MFPKDQYIKFLGYQRKKMPRGEPALTVGKVYRVEKPPPEPGWRYTFVRNDRGALLPYPAKNFEKVDPPAA